MPHDKAHATDAESVLPDDIDGEMWMMRDVLDCEKLGFTLLSLEPHQELKAHDHAEDGQEEIYFVVEGGIDVKFDNEAGGHTVSLDEHEALRIDPEETRQIVSRDEYAEVVLAGAPISAQHPG